ncbi:hypothetical protein O4J56_26915 [Nocardiopsis sp. RSe5-2]|uniref:Uncharacterized protein n=1 Tax=Nocardiopsis endophytica TaxID=3018445 RepID=A0ABT4UBE7_9ACTN|nr:hypothetical protein [Nocardiopsis endophytica]MDA2814308.1 hypothetical protein [Nocardiopsis endophytica]
MNIALRIILHVLQVVCLLIAAVGGIAMLAFALSGEEMVSEDLLISNTFIVFALLGIAFAPSKWTLKRNDADAGKKAAAPAPHQPHGAPAPQAQPGPYPPHPSQHAGR